MNSLPVILAALGFLATSVVGVLGYIIRRAIAVHDENERATQAMIASNTHAMSLASAENVHAHTLLSKTLTDVLAEARDTNHRITVLEARELVRRENDQDSHQQRGD